MLWRLCSDRWELLLLLFGPGFRRDFVDLVVGHVREAGEDVPQIGIGVEAAAAAALNDRVNDGAVFPGPGLADKEPVLFAQGGGPDGVFHQVVVDQPAELPGTD